MKTEDALRLVVIDDSSNDAEVVTSMLRNAGHGVRTERVEDEEDLEALLRESDWDMVLTKPRTPIFSAVDALQVISDMERDVPVLILLHDAADAEADENLSLLDAGARDIVSVGQQKRLIHALMREFEDVRRRHRHRQCEALLRETNVRAHNLVESSRDAIAYVHEGMHIFANHTYLELFGYDDLDELQGTPIMNMVALDDQEAFKKFLRQYLKGKAQQESLEIKGQKADGGNFEITMEFSPASYEGEECIQIIIRDQSNREELEEELNQLRKVDLLTGVYNRRHFIENLEGVVAAGNSQGAVFNIAIDNFQKIREEIGIAESDALLTDIAHILDNLLPNDGDVLSRFEGATFAALLQGASLKDAEVIAERMLKAVETHTPEGGSVIVTHTLSIGIAPFDQQTKDAHALLGRAEKAGHKAYADGGDRLHIYTVAEEQAKKDQAQHWESQIRAALRDGRFHLYYQPIVSLHGDANENYQILLRMTDSDDHEVMPGEFIPAAEKAGLMVAIDRWVILHAVKVLANRLRNGRATNFFIKLSADSLKDPDFLTWLRDLLRAAKLGPHVITLEISEAVVTANFKAVRLLAEGLKQLHVRLTLDHFGQAPNWEALLKRSDVDFVKVDGNIIRHLAQDPQKQDQVKEITSQAKDAGKFTIAEFVEDANTLAVLWSCGIDYIQGYFLQEPDRAMNYDFAGETM